MNTAAIEQKIRELGPWFHHIEIGGVWTRDVAPSEGHQDHDHPKRRWDAFEKYLPQNPRGMKILDIGCAEGFFSIELAKRGAEMISVDAAPKMIRRLQWAAEALDLPNIDARVGKIETLPEGEKYDAILFLALLYHLDDPIHGIKLLAPLTDLIYVDSVITPGDDTIMKLHPPIPGVSFVPKWFPTQACIVAMLKYFGFNEVEVILDYPYKGRSGLIGRRV